MTTTNVISNKQYEAMDIDDKIGTLMFADIWYDCLSYVDTKNLKKSVVIPKGARILKVLVMTNSHPEFKNIINKTIPYKHPVCAHKTADGAYQREDLKKLMGGDLWWINNPLGDAIIVCSV